MKNLNPSPNRVLLAIPAYNEEVTIDKVVHSVRECVPDFDLLIVDDGSRDATGQIVQHLGVLTATHLCNLGYGRAIQTAMPASFVLTGAAKSSPTSPKVGPWRQRARSIRAAKSSPTSPS